MKFLKVERASLLEFGGDEIRVTVSQNADGTSPAPQIISAKEVPWSLTQLRSGQRICFSTVAELPAEASVDRDGFRKLGTQSLIALPLAISGETLGALAFASVTAARQWPIKTAQRLRVAEDLFASLLLRWRSEKAVSEAETRFQALANFMQDWEYWESPEGSVRFCSPACERITGYRPEQFLVEPKLLREIVLPEDANLCGEFQREAFAHPQQRSLQFRIRRADGQVRWLEHHSQPVYDEQGHFLGVRASNRDYTAEKEAELQSQRLREELARVSRMTTADHLAASLAHELRQPLAAIMSNAEAAQQFLEQEPLDLNELREALEDVVRNDERASQIIQRLRALYRRSGQEHGPLDLNRVIEETLSLLRSDLILRQVSWEQRLATELPRVAGNRIELQQVLMNLIVNARDAMSEIDPTGRRLLVCSTLESPTRAQVSVTDSGSGIAPETAAHLLEPFFTTKDAGMGMGLAISRSIIEAHGGRFWAENNAERGATFHFTIPILKAER